MPEPIEKLLQRPEVAEAIGNINQELVERRQYRPPVCPVFTHPVTTLAADDSFVFEVDRHAALSLPTIIKNRVQRVVGEEDPPVELRAGYEKPRNIGIVFSGGPSPGGHNVIAGLYDAAKRANSRNRVYGFLMGPDGIIENESVEITAQRVDAFRNLGGFTMIRTGRTKIDTPEKIALSKKTCRELDLDALVIVGGDDSNTNAAFLAEALKEDGVQVIGVPKTIDGDIQVKDANGRILCAISFGFHTAARAFSNAVANLCTDSSSDAKYWHICKVMGRVASHLALETALQTHANMTLIGEDLADYVDEERIKKAENAGTVDYTAYGMTLRHLSRIICNAIVRRAAFGKNYGVIVLPEGILEFINEIQMFIIKFNTIIAEYNRTHDNDFHTDFPFLKDKRDHLRRLARLSREEDETFSTWNTRDDDLFNDIPAFFQEGLLTERDSHGNFQFSQVETEKVLMGLVKDYLGILQERGEYRIGIKKEYFRKILSSGGMDPESCGKAIFKDYDAPFLLIQPEIISLRTLRAVLVKAGILKNGEKLSGEIKKIYKAATPNFKTQIHFYGYDGRGNDPTRFDCNYTYNLGRTVFSLIANGATGQMAAIKNLEKDFTKWEPMGIPIAPLMHLEERMGKLTLVMEKAVVDVESTAFRAVKACREKWLAASEEEDHYRHPGPIRFMGSSVEDRPLTLKLNSCDSQD